MRLLGEAFSAREALEWGLVNRVAPVEQLEEASLSVCRRLSTLDPAVTAHFKRVLNTVGLDRFQRAIDEESRATRMLMMAPPPRAGAA